MWIVLYRNYKGEEREFGRYVSEEIANLALDVLAKYDFTAWKTKSYEQRFSDGKSLLEKIS